MNKAIWLFILICSMSNLYGQVNNKKLSLNEAVEMSVKNNAELKVYRSEIKALGAVVLQSGLNPNPELEVEAENILGNEDFSGFKGSEITAKISQNILLAGKISKREKIAELNISLAEWDYEAKRLEVITNVRSAFGRAIATQKQIEQNKELVKLSEEFIINLKERIKAGKISPAEVSRAQIILNSLQIELNRLKFEYDASIAELSTLVNDPALSFESLIGDLNYISNIPVYDSLLMQLENNPNLKRYDNEYDKQKAVIDFEESKLIPDLTISAGYKRLNEVKASTLVLGASIPLPIFNRNQGSIQEAQIRYDQKKTEYEVIKNKLTLQLNLLYNRLGTLLVTTQKLKNESIPDAEETFRIIKEGNLSGRFTILDVLDTERTLFEIQNQYLNTVGEINTVIVEMEGLIVNKIRGYK